jgi:hypothetical protein
MKSKLSNSLRDAKHIVSLHKNKHILKSRSNGLLQPNVIEMGATEGEYVVSTLKDELDTSEKEYSEKLARLKRFKTKTKTLAKVSNLKSEWMKEHQMLQSSCKSTEDDITSILEVLMLHSAGQINMNDGGDNDDDNGDDGDNASYVIQREYEMYRKSRDDEQKQLMEQLGQIKELWGFTKVLCTKKKNDNNQQSSSSTSAKDGDDEAAAVALEEKNRIAHATSIFADLLVQTQQAQSSQWLNLQADEEALTTEIHRCRLDVGNMLKSDRHMEQNQALSRELTIREDDDVEVQLHMEEWYNRLRSIDCAHEDQLSVLATQRQNDMLEYHRQAQTQTVDLRASTATAENGNELEQNSSPETDTVTVTAIDTSSTNTRSNTSTTTTTTTATTTTSNFPQPWNQATHLIFTKLHRNASSTGQSRHALDEQIRIQLPQMTSLQLKLHENWYRKTKLLNDKKKVLNEKHEEIRRKLLIESKVSLEKFRVLRKAQIEDELEQQLRKKERNSLHLQLNKLKLAKDELQCKLDEEAALQAKQKHEEEVQLKAIEDRRQEWNKKQVEIFQKMKESLLLQQQEERRRAEEQELQLLKENIEQDRHKVEARQRLIDEKENKKRENELKQLEKERLKMEFLMELASQVPYYENIQNATSQLDHITQAVKAQQYEGYEEESRGHKKSTGYADKQVIGNARFRLATALREAGLANSHAAKAAVQQYFPRPHLAIHGALVRGAVF